MMYLQSIHTKYHTRNGNSRCSATSSNGVRVYVDWDQGANTDENHLEAMIKLCDKCGWPWKDYVPGAFNPGLVWVKKPK